MSSHLGLSIVLMTCSKTLECDQLKTANTKLTEELAQVKEKYTSQLKDGVRIKTEVGAAWEVCCWVLCIFTYIHVYMYMLC